VVIVTPRPHYSRKRELSCSLNSRFGGFQSWCAVCDYRKLYVRKSYRHSWASYEQMPGNVAMRDAWRLVQSIISYQNENHVAFRRSWLYFRARALLARSRHFGNVQWQASYFVLFLKNYQNNEMQEGSVRGTWNTHVEVDLLMKFGSDISMLGRLLGINWRLKIESTWNTMWLGRWNELI
jgi:hypothetical protein